MLLTYCHCSLAKGATRPLSSRRLKLSCVALQETWSAHAAFAEELWPGLPLVTEAQQTPEWDPAFTRVSQQ